MRVWKLSFLSILLSDCVFACSVNLAYNDPPITTENLEEFLANRRQGCPDPTAIYLDHNGLTSLPESSKYVPVNWTCTDPLIPPKLLTTSKGCQMLCTDTPGCGYVAFSRGSCAVYAPANCYASNATLISYYRRETFFTGMDGIKSVLNIDLSDNQFTSVPLGLSRFSRLTELDLSGNKIPTLPDNFFNYLTSLEQLSVSRNNLTDVGSGFGALSNLQLLALDWNNFSSIPVTALAKNSELTSLTISHNPLTSLAPDTFRALGKLTQLQMSFLPLTSLPSKIFSNLTLLNYLELNNNQLDSLQPDVFEGLSRLTTILLNYNNFEALPPGVFSAIKGLRKLDLDRPPECSLVQKCAGKVQVGLTTRTFVITPTTAPTPAPTATPTTPAPSNLPTQSPSAVSPMMSSRESTTSTTETEVSSKLVGGVIGGVLGFTCLLFICAFLIHRRYRQKRITREPAKGNPEEGGLLAEPKVSSDGGGSGGNSKSATDPTFYDSRTPKSVYSGYSTMSPYSPANASPPTPTANPLAQVFRKGMRPYTVMEVLGKGNFGTAYLVTDPKMDQYVVKTIVCKEKNDVMKEAKTLALNPPSPHLVRMIDFFFESDQLFCVVLNYCRGGSLLDLIPQRVDPNEVERILREIAEGLSCLHEKVIIHRDLKPDNVFLLDPESRLVVIGDMGMARELNEDGYYSSGFGHNLYKAPEIESSKFSPRSDMWAVGCIGLELLSGESMAHRHQATRLVLGRIASQEELSGLLNSLPAYVKEHNAFKMISNLLVIDPYRRLTAKQLLVFPALLPPEPGSPAPQVELTKFDYQ